MYFLLLLPWVFILLAGTAISKVLDYTPVLGCCVCGKSLVASGAAGLASMRRHKKLPPCQTETVPASSKRDPPLAKAEPVSKAGRTFVIMYVRKGENKTLLYSCERQEWENVREAALEPSKPEKGEKVLHASEQIFLCSPQRRPWWRRLSPCSP